MRENALTPFHGWAGPRNARIILISDAWNDTEENSQQPLVGSPGRELWHCLGIAWDALNDHLWLAAQNAQWSKDFAATRGGWLARNGIALTSVFPFIPPNSRVSNLCGKSKDFPSYPKTIPALGRTDKDYPEGAFLNPEYFPHVEKLLRDLHASPRNIIVPLGSVASWACLLSPAIAAIRGNATRGLWAAEGLKVLPTYSPLAVMANYSLKPVLVSDLGKVQRASKSPEIIRRKRKIYIEPSKNEVRRWLNEAMRAREIGVDVETRAKQITCIGISRGEEEAIVIPFWLLDGRSYWDSSDDEAEVWWMVKEFLEKPDGPKIVGQNFLYDLQYFHAHGIYPKRCAEDTMFLHHSLFPEMQKGLGFLASIYADEESWKLMRRDRPDTEKVEE
jgi:uracil-DNA glycosylase